MARPFSPPTVLKWLLVIGGLVLVVWLLLRGRKGPVLPEAEAPVLLVSDHSGPLRELDARLAAEGVVDKALFDELREALDYNAASSVPYANNRLRVLRARIRRGQPLQVYVPDQPDLHTLTTEAEFDEWERRWLPGANSR